MLAFISGDEEHKQKELEYIGTVYLQTYVSLQYLALSNIMIHSKNYGGDIYTQYINDDVLQDWISQGDVMKEEETLSSFYGEDIFTSSSMVWSSRKGDEDCNAAP